MSEAPVEVSRGQVEAALSHFRGVITQVPPMYSAVKCKGTPLHRLARRGIVVECQPRRVEIFSLDLTVWQSPELELEMTCSSGTYVRTLAHDLGRALGCGAHLTALTRLASGSFRLENAVTLDECVRAVAEGGWPSLLHPIEEALTHFPPLYLDADSARRLCLGQTIPAQPPVLEEVLARAYGPDGDFLALAIYDPAAGVWRPHKVFFTAEHLS